MWSQDLLHEEPFGYRVVHQMDTVQLRFPGHYVLINISLNEKCVTYTNENFKIYLINLVFKKTAVNKKLQNNK